jgi:hypothetical protein
VDGDNFAIDTTFGFKKSIGTPGEPLDVEMIYEYDRRGNVKREGVLLNQKGTTICRNPKTGLDQPYEWQTKIWCDEEGYTRWTHGPTQDCCTTEVTYVSPAGCPISVG